MKKLALFALATLAACGPETGLSGSVSELFSLEVSRVEVRRNEQAFQVTYLRNRGVFLDVVARVSVSLEGATLVPGKKIDLAGEYAPGHLRTTVATAPGGEPVRQLPPVKKGDLVITSGGGVGQVTSGNFSMSFSDMGGDLGAGRTLAGTFKATALDAGFGELP